MLVAVSLVNIGRLEMALPMFREIFKVEKNWRTLTPRLIPSGLLNVNEEELQKIIREDY